MKVGLIGCGDIARQYVESMRAGTGLDLVGVASRRAEQAAEFAAVHKTKAYATVEALLADKDIELVLNLTPNNAHPEVTKACLKAGKHVYSEKPLATDYPAAAALIELARSKGLALACAPCTFLGEAQQTAGKLLRQNAIGKLKLVYAEVNHGRIETWHPSPLSFYQTGPLFDVGVYPLSFLASVLGPASTVQAYGKVLLPERKDLKGQAFRVETPDHLTLFIQYASGPLARLTVNFYVDGGWRRQKGLEFHGDLGSLCLPDHFSFNAELQMGAFEKAYEPVPLLGQPYAGGVDWARGVRDLAEAITLKRAPRCDAGMAAHVVETIEASYASIKKPGPVGLKSSFKIPEPMPWA